MVAWQKHNRQSALLVVAALKRWWSLSLFLSHAGTTQRYPPALTPAMFDGTRVYPYDPLSERARPLPVRIDLPKSGSNYFFV